MRNIERRFQAVSSEADAPRRSRRWSEGEPAEMIAPRARRKAPERSVAFEVVDIDQVAERETAYRFETARFDAGRATPARLPAPADGGMSRRALLGYAAVGAAGAAAVATVGTGPSAQANPNYLRGLGDFRRLTMTNPRAEERLNIIYFADGEYIPEALDELNTFLRDWRRNEVAPIDVRSIDICAAFYRKMDTEEPLTLISGYRSPATNSMLRRNGRGVARNSYHTRAMALDVTLRTRSVSQMFRSAMSLRAGGVGRYTRSHFVHVDCGPLRSWGR